MHTAFHVIRRFNVVRKPVAKSALSIKSDLEDHSFSIFLDGQHALRSLMNKSRILEYIAVTGLWAALVYQFIYPIFPGRLSSVTTFVLLVPLVIYWVLRERLLVWGDDDTDDK